MGIKSPEVKEDYVSLQPHGFVPDHIVEGDHYVLGAYSKIQPEILMPAGQWRAYLPAFEAQSRTGLETMNCTNYGTLAIIETLFRFHFQIEAEFSERYTGVLTETTRQGNSPHHVAEVIRDEVGLIAEHLLPFDESIRDWDDYYSPDPMTPPLLEEGFEFLETYKISHEWVFNNGNTPDKHLKMQQALRYSPLGVSVVAWKKRSGKYWKEKGEPDNHWCVVYGYREGDAWLVFDTYDGGFKELEWDYDFGFAKWYALEAIAKVEQDWSAQAPRLSWWQAILQWLFGNREFVIEK
jgi:hypothetical protein